MTGRTRLDATASRDPRREPLFLRVGGSQFACARPASLGDCTSSPADDLQSPAARRPKQAIHQLNKLESQAHLRACRDNHVIISKSVINQSILHCGPPMQETNAVHLATMRHPRVTSFAPACTTSFSRTHVEKPRIELCHLYCVVATLWTTHQTHTLIERPDN